MPYVTSKLVGYGVVPPEDLIHEPQFTVVGLWTYRGKCSGVTVVGHYSNWLRAAAVKNMLERAKEN
jgi:hypothetical protein